LKAEKKKPLVSWGHEQVTAILDKKIPFNFSQIPPLTAA
jgi:hypothetical protein